MSITEFCDRHNACNDGRAWALANCRDMDHAWETLKPEWLVWVATRPGVLDDRTLRLFAVWCARQVQPLMQDERSLAALDVAERHANGQASDEELRVARDAALDASWDSALDAARAAAQEAAREAAREAAQDAARAAQADWLRANAKPNWEAEQ